MPAPLLIALPQGLNISGVAMWAARLANGMVARGRGAALVLHRCPGAAGDQVPIVLDPRVQVVRVEDANAGAPPLETCGGDLSLFIPIYMEVARGLAREHGGPVVISPNLHGDCYGVAAAMALVEPALVRIVGWQHSDIEYDVRLLMHYEPMLAKFVGVSDAIEEVLRARLRGRAEAIVNIAYGVELPRPTAARSVRPRGNRALRMIYSGRLDHEQKRVLALAWLGDALAARGIEHELTIVGDGPAAADLDEAVGARASVHRMGRLGPERIQSLLDEHDVFILPSRYEGLSVAMLEAMARGCVPVLAQMRSGAAQAIEPGYNGELADVAPEADERAVAEALAEAIARHIGRGDSRRAEMADAAAMTIRDRYSLDLHLDRVEQLIDGVARSPARSWPSQRPCAFTAASGDYDGSGSVPREGRTRLTRLLERLAGRSVIIHGTGQHTLQLGAVIASSPAKIVALTDDDRQRQGGMLWNWPIIAPASAAAAGATDVVISSWMHQEAIWSRRGIYESQGLRVHRIYDASPR